MWKYLCEKGKYKKNKETRLIQSPKLLFSLGSPSQMIYLPHLRMWKNRLLKAHVFLQKIWLHKNDEICIYGVYAR